MLYVYFKAFSNIHILWVMCNFSKYENFFLLQVTYVWLQSTVSFLPSWRSLSSVQEEKEATVNWIKFVLRCELQWAKEVRVKEISHIFVFRSHCLHPCPLIWQEISIIESYQLCKRTVKQHILSLKMSHTDCINLSNYTGLQDLPFQKKENNFFRLILWLFLPPKLCLCGFAGAKVALLQNSVA